MELHIGFKNSKLFFILLVCCSVIASLYLSTNVMDTWLTPRNYNLALHHNDSKFPRPKAFPCRWVPETFMTATRYQCFLRCQATGNNSTDDDQGDHHKTTQRWSPNLHCKQVVDSADNKTVPSVSAENVACLKTFIRANCYGKGHVVPRVAHYVRFGTYNLTLDAFISMYSVSRFLQPCVLLYHGDSLPWGPYWRALLHLIPNIVHIPTDRPREIFGRNITFVQHSSDVTRMRALLEYGGVYLDFDQFLLNPLDNLMHKSTVLGYQYKNHIGNGLIVAEPNAEFLRLWMASYTSFNPKQWGEHCCVVPVRLAVNYSHLVHMVDTFFPPTPRTRNKLLLYDTNSQKRFRWKHRYSVHVYNRHVHDCFYGAPVRIDQQDNSMGDMIKHILHGDHHDCTGPEHRRKVPCCINTTLIRLKGLKKMKKQERRKQNGKAKKGEGDKG